MSERLRTSKSCDLSIPSLRAPRMKLLMFSMRFGGSFLARPAGFTCGRVSLSMPRGRRYATLGIVPGLIVLMMEQRRTPSPSVTKKSSPTSRPAERDRYEIAVCAKEISGRTERILEPLAGLVGLGLLLRGDAARHAASAVSARHLERAGFFPGPVCFAAPQHGASPPPSPAATTR